MSAIGHALDMIGRFNANRQLQKERHFHYAKVKKAYMKVEEKHIPLKQKSKLSPADLSLLKEKIRTDIN